MAAKRFYRSTTEKKIAGVCGGIADYFDVDVTLVRALLIGLSFLGGWGIIVYLVLWLSAPQKPS